MFSRVIKHIIFSTPGILGNFFRCKLINKSSRKIKLFENGWIEFPKNITIGDGTSINRNFFINAYGKIKIGKEVLIGPYVTIYSTNHIFSDKDKPINSQGQTRKEVIIEDDVWIGAHAIILQGVKIGKGAVIGAGSVVTKNIEPYSIYAGIPAHKIGER